MCVGRTLQKRGKTETTLSDFLMTDFFFFLGRGGCALGLSRDECENMISPHQQNHLLLSCCFQYEVWFLYDQLIESGFVSLQHCVN